jgi:sentrin-specific protease 1
MSKDGMIKDKKHYMDTRFWVSLFPINNVIIYCIYTYNPHVDMYIYLIQRMVGFGKLPKYHQNPTAEELAKTLDCWPSLNYYITGCKYVSMYSFRMYL